MTSAVRKAKRSNHKQVVVVTGGPGSGKSVVALSVLGELYGRGMTALHADVVIGQWARPWNVYGDRSVLGAPPAPLWATDPDGFGQVGCVYTAQGFEYDWSGVIIGPDLVWRTDHWVVDRSASKDPIFTKATPDSEINRLIRNTYKVLLTRGMVGTIIYSTDPETRDKLRSLVSSTSEAEANVLV